MKKIITMAAIGSGALYLQAKIAKDPTKRWVKSGGAQSVLLITSIVAGAYLLVK